MAIDRRDYEDLIARMNGKTHPMAMPEFRMVGMDEGWQDLMNWVTTQTDDAGHEVDGLMTMYRVTSNISTENLSKLKSLLDIAQAKLCIMQMVKTKMQSYHSQEDA